MQSDLPLVTIGIPTFNQDAYLASAIESALLQDYPNLEIVIADDCSSDNTRGVIENYLSDKRLKYFRNETNLGRVLNYRKLFYEYASGEWYVNLDGDDYYIDHHFITTGIEKIYSFKEKGHEIMFYHSGLKTIIKDQTITFIPNIAEESALISGKSYFNHFFTYNAASHLTIICNRHKALTIGYYSKDTLFTDVHSFVRLALHGHVILDKRISAVWRLHNKNASHLLEKHLEDEIASNLDISTYAIPFVGEKKARKWFKKANRELIHNLIYKNIKFDSVNKEDWVRYFKYFRLSTFFIKHFIKYVFLSTKNRKFNFIFSI
ncbi:MAG: glycosyltransferase family 2 protein [Flavisolibacter sp.]|nr:glycosyltransferase family 2 protein [Flavisolibacter sp.]